MNESASTSTNNGILSTMASSSPPSETSSNSRMPPMINILNAVAFVANIFVMYGLRLFLSINSEVLASFPTLITPTSWACLLWPLIVLFEFAWVVLQLLPKYRSQELVTLVGRNFIFASVAQIAWSLFFSYQILSLSFLSIIAMLVFLFIIFRAQSNVECSLHDYFYFKFTFSLLFGWIVIACIVDINVLLVAMGVSTTAQFYAALVSLSAILIVAGSVQDFTVLSVLAWAMLGIFVEISNPDYYIESMFQASYVTTIHFYSLAVFLILVAIIAWRGYSAWRNVTKKPRVEMTAATTAEGDYVTMA